jgi:hypothetical protein
MIKKTLLGLALIVSCLCGAQDISDRETVLSVQGNEIRYEDIKIDPYSKSNIASTFGISAAANASIKLEDPIIMERLQGMAHKREIGVVISKIREIIHQDKLKTFNVKVTENEVEERAASLKKLSGPQLKQYCVVNELILKALTAMREEKINAETAYNTFLSKVINKNEWENAQLNYDTIAKQNELREAIKSPEIDYKNVVRCRIMEEKFEDAIDKDIAEHYPNLRNHIEETHTALADKNDALRDLWWREQYKKANIEIKNEKYRPVLSLLGIIDNEAAKPNVKLTAPNPAPPDK